LYISPNFPHLRNVRLSIRYTELPEQEGANPFATPAKWKQDKDAASREGFAPQEKYYVNGQFDGEKKPGHYTPSKTPFPVQRVPRRNGITAVSPEDPDYPRLCVEQGLGHLLSEQQKLSVPNGSHLTPRSMASNDTGDGMNGGNLSPTATVPMTNGIGSNHPQDRPEQPLANGINGTPMEEH
jgi:hypothetical protein